MKRRRSETIIFSKMRMIRFVFLGLLLVQHRASAFTFGNLGSFQALMTQHHKLWNPEKVKGKVSFVPPGSIRKQDLWKMSAIEDKENTMDVGCLTVEQLKQELRKHGLRVSGKKADLVQRLLDAGVPLSSEVLPEDWKERLKVGDVVDAMDSDKRWFESIILEMTGSRVKVHFKGWSSKWDSYIDINSDGIKPLHTKTPKWRNFQVDQKLEVQAGTDLCPRWYDGKVLQVDRQSKKILVKTAGKIQPNKWVDMDGEDICDIGTHKNKKKYQTLLSKRKTRWGDCDPEEPNFVKQKECQEEKAHLQAERLQLETERKVFEEEKTAFEKQKKEFEEEKAGLQAERLQLEAERKVYEEEKNAFEEREKEFERKMKADVDEAEAKANTEIDIAEADKWLLSEWLETIKLQQYCDSMIEAGVSCLDDLIFLDKDILKHDVQMRPVHIKKLLEKRDGGGSSRIPGGGQDTDSTDEKPS